MGNASGLELDGRPGREEGLPMIEEMEEFIIFQKIKLNL
jgi:hypothetical protein